MRHTMVRQSTYRALPKHHIAGRSEPITTPCHLSLLPFALIRSPRMHRGDRSVHMQAVRTLLVSSAVRLMAAGPPPAAHPPANTHPPYSLTLSPLFAPR